jgi:hypothetical protein
MGRRLFICWAAALTVTILLSAFGVSVADAAQKTASTPEAAEAGRWSLLIAAGALVIGLPVLLFLFGCVLWVLGKLKASGKPVVNGLTGPEQKSTRQLSSPAAPWPRVFLLGDIFHGLLVGQDKRVSTSKTVATVWTYVVASALLSLVVAKWLGHGGGLHNQTQITKLQAQYALLIGGPLGAAILAKGIVGSQTASGTASKPPSPDGPNASQLVSNDQDATDLGDLQYVLFNTVALIFFFGEFLRTPVSGLPTLPDLLVGLTSVSAVGYVSKKALPSTGSSITDIQPSHGKQDDWVRIFGTGLIEKGAPTEVRFDDVHATDVRPIATTPNGPAVDVRVPAMTADRDVKVVVKPALDKEADWSGKTFHVDQPAQRIGPLNVFVAGGSAAEKAVRTRAGAPDLPPTPDHDLIFHGGKTIPNLVFVNFYAGSQAQWWDDDMQNIDSALSEAMSDPGLNNVMAQYFPGQKPTTEFQGSTVLGNDLLAKVTQGDVEQMIRDLYAGGIMESLDLARTVFNILLPSGVVLTVDPAPGGGNGGAIGAAVEHPFGVPVQEEADSRHGLGGYHGSVHVVQDEPNPVTVYYSVGVFSEQNEDGSSNGIPVFDEPWKNVVATFYHELNEARTDADVEDAIKAGKDPLATRFLGWVSPQGEECGDFPISEAGKDLGRVFQEVRLTDGSGVVPVQFQYSNAVHGPQGPIPSPD